MSLLFLPVTQDDVVHDIATADTSPAIKGVSPVIKPFVMHDAAALCAFHGWSAPLKRSYPAKSFLKMKDNHFFWECNVFDVENSTFFCPGVSKVSVGRKNEVGKFRAGLVSLSILSHSSRSVS